MNTSDMSIFFSRACHWFVKCITCMFPLALKHAFMLFIKFSFFIVALKNFFFIAPTAVISEAQQTYQHVVVKSIIILPLREILQITAENAGLHFDNNDR